MRFARSLGYLDWASQPRPFRTFHDAWRRPLHPAPGGIPPSIDPDSRASRVADAGAIGEWLRYSLGLSAWKRAGDARWSLRVNPSSGNLHPTEGYVVCSAVEGWGAGGVFHYDAEQHVIERRANVSDDRWTKAFADGGALIVGLSSIHWRESWKYGERAFRYCQHDLGHAIACLAIAASLRGWRTRMLPEWSHTQIATLLGLDRQSDFVEAEREEPACLLWVSADRDDVAPKPEMLTALAAAGEWTGRASQLSEEHVQWTFIDDVAAATNWAGKASGAGTAGTPNTSSVAASPASAPSALPGPPVLPALILQRRSAVAFDARTSISKRAFTDILNATRPGAGAPWSAVWWSARIHFALFVHRVADLPPGLYVFVRDPEAAPRLKAECRDGFSWEAVDGVADLFCLGVGDCRSMARRLSCDQDIAADGCFSLGMIADFQASLDAEGPAFYRHLFWESGVIGQMLYLAAEAEGVRGTGIGCFYDDPVHEMLGLSGHAFQSLYHFTIGGAVEDRRLTVEPGYGWESAAVNASVNASIG